MLALLLLFWCYFSRCALTLSLTDSIFTSHFSSVVSFFFRPLTLSLPANTRYVHSSKLRTLAFSACNSYGNCFELQERTREVSVFGVFYVANVDFGIRKFCATLAPCVYYCCWHCEWLLLLLLLLPAHRYHYYCTISTAFTLSDHMMTMKSDWEKK